MGGWGGQDGCERRIEVFVKIQKKWGSQVGGGDFEGGQGGCDRRIEFFCENSKKKLGWGGLGRGGGIGLDLNEELKFL